MAYMFLISIFIIILGVLGAGLPFLAMYLGHKDAERIIAEKRKKKGTA